MRTTRGVTLAALALIIALGALGLAACRAGSTAGEEPAEKKVYTGTIKSGFVGAGGEHTGWMLMRGGKDPDLEVDVSAVLSKAKELDGTKVRASGTMIEKAYVERGTVPILQIETLQAAPQ